MRNYKTYQFVLILTPFVFSFAFGLDIYIPVIPQMTEIFGTTQTMVHLTLSLFLLVTGLGQLLIGPLSDHYGRKPVFYAASTCYAVGAVLCAVAPQIGWLIVGRFVCSLGACGMLVTSFALVRDVYASDDSARMYSFLNGAIGISPTFAPIIGGYLAVYFGWQSIFSFLALIGVFAITITRLYIEETHPPEKRVPMSKAVFKRYVDIFTHPQFLVYSLISGLAEGIFFCFFSISPFIIIDQKGEPTHYFG
jgi:Bcr/CflA subfamily drug resistance transporter